jgi:chromosome segregation ATPase
MSLPESEETLSAIKQLQEKMKTEQGIFEEANKDLKVLQRDIREKQTALEDLRENLQEEDNDASELLGELWKQQEKIKGHLDAQSADEIKKAVQEQNEFIDLERGRIEQESENIASNRRLCQELDWFLHGDGKNIDNIDIERRKGFSQLLEGNDKEQLLEKNSQLMVELNASMKNLEKRDGNLIELKKDLEKQSLDSNLATDIQQKLQKLFEERQAEIEKDIKAISEQEPILAKQYENIILQEKEIKKIQDEIDAKTKIIKQSKQKEEQLSEELKQLEQKSYPPLSSAKQQQDPVSQYPILQERANDAEASLKRQIELSKLNKQLEIAESKIDDQDHQSQQLKLSADKERLSANVQIQKNLERISELQERIRELEREKKEQQQPTISHERSLADELQELGELDGSLSSQIDKLTSENDNLKTKLKEVENEKKQLETLSGARELEYSKAKEDYTTKLREVGEELSKLKSEQQAKQAELQKTKEELTSTSEKLLEAERLHGKESEQAKKLQAEVKELTNVQHQLTTELKETREGAESRIAGLTKEKESATLDLQVARLAYEAMLKGQSEAAAAELQTINEKLSQLKLEQQESRSELEKKQQELIIVQESLKAAEQEYGVESKQAKELQAQLGGLTNENNSLKTQLEEIENEKKQLVELSGEKDLEYNYSEAEYEKQQAELKKIQQAKLTLCFTTTSLVLGYYQNSSL